MFIKDYSNLSIVKSGPLGGTTQCIIQANFDTDISELFPYINADIFDAVYYEKPDYIKFSLEKYYCALHPHSVAASPCMSKEEGVFFLNLLFDFLNNLSSRRDSIVPNYKKKKYIPVLDIFKLLPQTNCRECGFLTCLAFAAELSRGEIMPEACPALNNPINENAVYPVYDKKGKLVSTITIDIDVKKRKFTFQKQKQYIENLENKISTLINRKRNSASENDPNIVRTSLTNREIEVLYLIGEGFTNPEISNVLSISPHTVKSHVIHILNKIGVNDRTQAAVWAARQKII